VIAPTPVIPLICQTTPRLKSKYRYWPDDKETSSIEGYQRFGKKWNSTLFEANKLTGRRFQWLVNINFMNPMPIDLLIKRKTRLTKELGRNEQLALFYRLQINETNRSLFHIHFAILDGFTDSIDPLKTVFEKACKPFRDEVRIFAEDIHYQYRYIPYINKTRDEDKNRIVLWSKDLPRFGKAGVLHYPWPEQWKNLPSISKTTKGGIRRRFLKQRRVTAKNEAEEIHLRGICWEFQQHLQDSMGISRYEVRKLLVSDLAHWENQCEDWIHTPEAKKYFQATKEKMDQAQAELAAIYKRKQINKAAHTVDHLELDPPPQPQSHTDAQDQSGEPIDEAKDPTDEIFQQKPIWNHPISAVCEALITRCQAPYCGNQRSTGPPNTIARPPPIFDVFHAMNLINRNCWQLVGGIEGKCANAVINPKLYGLITTSAIKC
jgi:hypothetical protein